MRLILQLRSTFEFELCLWPLTAIKVICVGSCGISSKLNDASWMLEEKYLSSTLSVADKGKTTNIHSSSHLISALFFSRNSIILNSISPNILSVAPVYKKKTFLTLKDFIVYLFNSYCLINCLSLKGFLFWVRVFCAFFLSVCMCQVSHNPLSMLHFSYPFKQETFHLFSSNGPHDNYNRSFSIEIMFTCVFCYFW